MRHEEIKIGEVYAAKISQRISLVRVQSEVPLHVGRAYRRRAYFECINLRTQRKVNCTAAKLRRHVPEGSINNIQAIYH